jgi:hypothetical protein
VSSAQEQYGQSAGQHGQPAEVTQPADAGPAEASQPAVAGQPEPFGPLPGQPPATAGAQGQQVSKREVYRSPAVLFIWWVWVAFALANLIDLALQGRDHFGAQIAALLILITGVVYVAAFRPRVTADEDGIAITNPLRDYQLPWGCVEDVDLGDSVLVSCRWQDGGERSKVFYCWAIHSPRRSRLKAEMRARRAASKAERQTARYGRLPPEVRAAMGKTDAENIAAALMERVSMARAAGVQDGKPVARWDPLAVLALVLPIVLVIIVLAI